MFDRIAKSITNLGKSLDNIHSRHVEHEREIYKTGWLSDEEKIRLLKYELYSSTSVRGNPEHLEQLRSTIRLLRNEIQEERSNQLSLPALANDLSLVVMRVGFLAVVFSYASLPYCVNNQSSFCADARKIPDAVTQYFSEK